MKTFSICGCVYFPLQERIEEKIIALSAAADKESQFFKTNKWSTSTERTRRLYTINITQQTSLQSMITYKFSGCELQGNHLA